MAELSEVVWGGWVAGLLFPLGSPALDFLFSVLDRTLVMALLTALAGRHAVAELGMDSLLVGALWASSPP